MASGSEGKRGGGGSAVKGWSTAKDRRSIQSGKKRSAYDTSELPF